MGVFELYQSVVFGSIDFGDPKIEEQCAPRLAESRQIWKLIRDAEISISDRCKDDNEEVVEFRMTFACSWDDEHGLGVKFRDWKIVGFGNAAE